VDFQEVYLKKKSRLGSKRGAKREWSGTMPKKGEGTNPGGLGKGKGPAAARPLRKPLFQDIRKLESAIHTFREGLGDSLPGRTLGERKNLQSW